MIKNKMVFIEGNSIASLVSAYELGSRNIECFLNNSTGYWGGHFGGFSRNKLNFDMGMVLYEFTAFNSQEYEPEIMEFDMFSRNDIGRYCKTLSKFVSQFHEFREIETPSMMFNGQIYDDITLANNIETLSQLPFKDVCKNELIQICKKIKYDSDMHPSNKYYSKNYKDLSFSKISKLIHGKTLHSYIWDPLCKKAIGKSSENLNALLHRNAWLPFYYPETLLSVLLDKKAKHLKTTKFYYPIKSTISSLILKLLEKINSFKSINLINSPVKNLNLIKDKYICELDNGQMFSSTHLLWGSSIDSLASSLGLNSQFKNKSSCSHTIIFISIKNFYIVKNFSILLIVDESSFIYRIHNQSNCSGNQSQLTNLTIEVSNDYLIENFLNININHLDEVIIQELEKLMILKENSKPEFIESINIKKSIPLPITNNKELFNKDFESISKKIPIDCLIGPSAGFSNASLNHQVLQGLKSSKSILLKNG